MINGKYKSVFIIPFAITVILKITTEQYEMIHEYLFFYPIKIRILYSSRFSNYYL